jgi:hypothetical protein
MSGRRQHKRKITKRKQPIATINVIHDAPCQEHPDQKGGADLNNQPASPQPKPKNWPVIITLFLTALTLAVYFTQAYYMRKAMRVDQRAWVNIPIPSNFPMTGTSIPVTLQIIDTGKTPARIESGKFVGTILEKGEHPHIGEFNVGHPYNKFTLGAVYPNSPVPLSIELQHYGDKTQQAIPVDETLRQEIANGKKYIIVFGRIEYTDMFDLHHWSQFCTGSGSAIDSDDLRHCVLYNDFDAEED